MKDKVYANAPQSIQELKEEIRAVIEEIEKSNDFLQKTSIFVINQN